MSQPVVVSRAHPHIHVRASKIAALASGDRSGAFLRTSVTPKGARRGLGTAGVAVWRVFRTFKAVWV